MAVFGLVLPYLDELAHKRHTRMRVNHSAGSRLIKRNSRRVEKRAERASFSTGSYNEKAEALRAKAARGDYESQFRLEAVDQLLNPFLEFTESDVKKIINKGYLPQVERGLKLYRLMSRLTVLCEPVGDAVGAASRLRLINFEDLTWSEFLDIKIHTIALLSRRADKRMTSEQFNGLALLTPEEKDLYERAKRYFGGRKKPTLKSLALDLLSEEGEVFVDRSASNHLAAVREFREKHKDKLGVDWYFAGGVDSYNKNPKSAREFYAECAASVRKAVRESVMPSYAIIGEMFVGVNEQIARSQIVAQQMALALPKILEQAESARKIAASAFAAAVRMPRIELPKSIFQEQLYIGKK
ncbi:MAG TPA: hypothetical protein VF297_00100 [Pyrinomonadaceae bacterium]